LRRINAQRFGISADQLTVEFTEVEKGMGFTGGKPSQASMVLGSVPLGTSQTQRVDLMAHRCVEAVARIAGVPTVRISMRTSSTQASWILEGGWVLSEPGEEDAWVAEHIAGV
jgi:hypothetical protein